MELCLVDVAEITGGQLWLAEMPPCAGELATIGRIVFSPQAVGANDVFWSLANRGGDVEQAFLHGALGVVIAAEHVEPWPGRFSLHVDDAFAALERLMTAVLRRIETDKTGATAGDFLRDAK